MTLLRGTAALLEAHREHRALGGFVAYNMETAQAIVYAAESTNQPVLLQAGSSAFTHAGLRPLAVLAREIATEAAVPIGLHLDHSRSLDEVHACLELGYTSVMVDGSQLSMEENVAFTRAAVQHAHRRGAWVEAELVGIAGSEDVSTDARPQKMTDPKDASAFVAATGVDALAVAVGNVHGFTSVPPEINLDRLEEIQAAVSVPLVLHGASGLASEVLLACVERGVAKVNVNAELRRAYLDALEPRVAAAREASDLANLLDAARTAVADRAREIVEFLARRGEVSHARDEPVRAAGEGT